jgi:Dit-like phage tail protein
MGLFGIVTSGNLLNSAPVLGVFLGNGFRPPQWSGAQLTSVSVVLPKAHTEAVSHNITFGDTVVPGLDTGATKKQVADEGSATTYFFDAVLAVDHGQEMRITEHPIQSGASISDHAYLLPNRVVLEIGMSDVMDSFVSGQYSDFNSKSVSAYRKFKELQELRIPLTLTTRLDTYENMMIEDVRTRDDISTLHALRAHIRFRQIFVGRASVAVQSSRPNATNTSNPGAAAVQSIPQSLAKNQDFSGQWNSRVAGAVAPPSVLGKAPGGGGGTAF